MCFSVSCIVFVCFSLYLFTLFGALLQKSSTYYFYFQYVTGTVQFIRCDILFHWRCFFPYISRFWYFLVVFLFGSFFFLVIIFQLLLILIVNETNVIVIEPNIMRVSATVRCALMKYFLRRHLHLMVRFANLIIFFVDSNPFSLFSGVVVYLVNILLDVNDSLFQSCQFYFCLLQFYKWLAEYTWLYCFN